MDLRTRLIAPIIAENRNYLDINKLINRVFLFDTYIIDSRGLKEIPYLLQIFGYDGLIEFLESGIAKLNCFVKTTASLGPTMFLDEEKSNKVRPLFHYSFADTSTGNLYYNLNLAFQRIEPNLNLSSRQLIRLRRTIYSALENPSDENWEALENTRNDLTLFPNLLLTALKLSIKKHIDFQITNEEIFVEIIHDSERDFHAKSNIQEQLNIDDQTAHKIIESACLAIAKRNDRVEQMKKYNALSGFSDIDLPIFNEKLSFLASAITPEVNEKRFQRVLELTGFPQFAKTREIKINIKNLLKIWDSTEAVEFRNWLAKTDGMSDEEIISQVRSISKIIGRIVGGESGKNVRFLLTNGLGAIPVVGNIISLPLSALDHFLVDKIFPRSGLAAFVDELYPSIFE